MLIYDVFGVCILEMILGMKIDYIIFREYRARHSLNSLSFFVSISVFPLLYTIYFVRWLGL